MLVAGILLLTNVLSYAQCICEGTIYDEITKETIPGVNVVLLDRSTGTISDFNGCYSMKLPKTKCKLQVSYIGYESAVTEINPEEGINKCNFYLKKKISEIGEVEVTAKSEARKKMEQGLPVTVLKPQDMLGVAGDVKSILTRIAGVKIKSLGGIGSVSKISIRGLEGKRVGFYLEGKPLNDQSDFLSLNDIPIDMIEQIEIYKGVIPAKFGGSAMGGAINLVLKEYPAKYVDYGYEYQSYNTHKTNLVLKNNRRDAGVQIGVGGFYTSSDNDYTMDNPYSQNLRVKRDHNKYNKLTAATGWEFTKTWFDEVKFEGAYLRERQEIQGIKTNIQSAFNLTQSVAGEFKLIKKEFFIDGLEFEGSAAVGYAVSNHVDTAMQRYNWNYELRPPVSKYGGEIDDTPNDSKNKKFTTVSNFNFNYLFDESNTLNLNIANTYINSKPEDLLKDKAIGHKTMYDSKVSNTTIGLTYDYRTKNDKFLSSICVKYYNYLVDTKLASRYTKITKDVNTNKSYFGFVYATRYRLTQMLMAKGSFAFDMRMPTQSELIGDGFLTTPSFELKPEENKSINIGLLYDRLKPGGSRLEMEFNAFYMDITDMIKLEKGFIRANYTNFGRMKNMGLEFEIKSDVYSWLYAYANVTYQDLRDNRKYMLDSQIPNPTKGDRMPNQPHFYTNAGVEFHKENFFGGQGQNSKLYIDHAFVEEFYHVFQQSNINNKVIPSSSTFNLGIEHSFENQKWTVALQADNLTDEKVVSEYNYPLPGRWIKAKVRFILK